MKKTICTAAAALAAITLSAGLSAQELRTEVFDMLDLDWPGLGQVKSLHSEGRDSLAAAALLDYYRSRKDICTPEIQDVSKVKISKTQQKWADEALDHTFYVHDGYQPSFNYGEDIDWQYWPVKDNELRWQLHRHKWFTPMGYAYRVSGDEKYAREWAFQYMDWIRKNPLVKVTKDDYEMVSSGEIKGQAENARFAWRPLEVSHRLQDQCFQFQLFIDSPSFTPEFLTEFLVNYHRHADHILHNYSEKGNHLLFEAQRMIYAGAFFPEFKEASVWRQSGVDILNREIKVQVYDDGGQFELDPHYHLATIEIFIKALQAADLNGFRSDFPQSYIDTVEKMIEFYANICFPDYTNPLFSDAKLTKKGTMIGNYRKWAKIFPDNMFIKYLATEGKEGALPDYLSKGFLNSGFFVFRNGWGMDALQMVVKAGPKGEWHCQPDNGTFEMWYNGRSLFQDSGSYVYAGDAEVMEWRNWFRATAHHNTLTLNDKDLETTESRTLLWQPEGDVQILVTENQSYQDLKHRRSVFFVDGTYFVIVDEAVGSVSGNNNVTLHYQMPRGDVPNSREDMTFYTNFEDGSNFMFRCFGPENMTMKKDKGWISTAYNKKVQRMDVSFNVKKYDSPAVRFITVIYPKEKAGKEPALEARFLDKGFSEDGLKIQVRIGKEKKRVLGYEL
ncbi:MAG: heparinase II/III family protein [Bacteroidetes bacterium]|uniref:Heparinase II/III family protein n=1 Tax=Candidatus Cryptobacteroides merdigallinarum TaxID=2840770 RepID=A0A9D9HG54_9BACT|nr:heparinase II/III family protein [Candidatus Cryptobacteroides merdigallinarum]